jgi:transposase-like protein
MHQCPKCKEKSKQIKVGKNHSGSQRYWCKICGEKYTPLPNLNGYPEELRKKAILMCLDGQTFRSIARKLGINHQTVVNWVNQYVAQSARAIYGHPKN